MAETRGCYVQAYMMHYPNAWLDSRSRSVTAANMADGLYSVDLVEIQKQYLQMAPLKGFLCKVSFPWF